MAVRLITPAGKARCTALTSLFAVNITTFNQSCHSFVIATRNHVKSGSNVVIFAAMRVVSGPRSFW